MSETKDILDGLFSRMALTADEPQYMIISPTVAAMMRAEQEFAGRNWRRIKREVRRAVDNARKSSLAAHVAPMDHWRSLASVIPA